MARAKSSRADSKSCSSVFMSEALEASLYLPHLSVLFTVTHFSLLDWIHTQSVAFLGRYLRWHLHLRVFNTTQASPSQVHTMASSNLHAGTPLTHTWPQHLSLSAEEDSTTLLLLYPSWCDSKARTTLRLPSSSAYWSWNLASALNRICISFWLLMVSFVAWASL